MPDGGIGRALCGLAAKGKEVSGALENELGSCCCRRFLCVWRMGRLVFAYFRMYFPFGLLQFAKKTDHKSLDFLI